jgi:uncharacterized protein YdcH (DUF465 family)
MQQVTDTPSLQLEKLLAEHRALDERVSQLEHQLFLTPKEELEVHELKKLKLHKKDQILGMRSRLGL